MASEIGHYMQECARLRDEVARLERKDLSNEDMFLSLHDTIADLQTALAAAGERLAALEAVTAPERLTIDLLYDWKSAAATQEAARLNYLEAEAQFKQQLAAANARAEAHVVG